MRDKNRTIITDECVLRLSDTEVWSQRRVTRIGGIERLLDV